MASPCPVPLWHNSRGAKVGLSLPLGTAGPAARPLLPSSRHPSGSLPTAFVVSALKCIMFFW